MSAVGPDEKVCPYCAEVIKSAAIKCRYCHSDLPVGDTTPPPTAAATAEFATAPDVEPGVEPGVETMAEPTAEPTASDPVEPPPADPRRSFDPVALGLGALCAVLAVLLIVLVLASRPGDLQVADSGQVTDPAFRSAALSEASADAEAVLSYSYKTLSEDQKKARGVLTPKFAREYESVMKDAGEKATTAKLTQKATVLTSSLVSISRTRATALVFVNSVTTVEGSTRQQLLQTRLRMELERKDGSWTVSKMTPIL